MSETSATADTPLRAVIWRDRETGAEESYGVLVRERSVDPYRLLLTYDEGRRLWWILVRGVGTAMHTCGYTEAHREQCWTMFKHADKHDVETYLLSEPQDTTP